MRLRRFFGAIVAFLVAAGIVAGVVTGTFSSAARTALYTTGLWTDGGASTLPPGVLDFSEAPATAEPTSPSQPDPVLAPASPVSAAKAARVAVRVNAVDQSTVQGRFGGTVIDAATGSVLYARNSRTPFVPASTLKLLTATAALSILGAQHRFTTRVVSAGPGRIVLVGGGDPYLTRRSTAGTYPVRASVAELAAVTARELKIRKQARVTLGYDASLFRGPAWNPDWPSAYRDQVSPVSALWVDQGRVGDRSPGLRVTNPARSAAQEFGQALKARGITVVRVIPAVAPRRAPQLAAAQSMPLERIVEKLLMASDNDAAEVVFRQAAIGAGKPGTNSSAQRVISDTLFKLGVWHGNGRIRDGSGLSRQNSVPSDMLAKVVRLALRDRNPELRSVATGLPVAGVEGSLRFRFFDAESRRGRGLVRAKTGTLRRVHSLAGYVRAADGSVLAYAFLVNNTRDEYAARVWLDRVSSALSSCGCR